MWLDVILWLVYLLAWAEWPPEEWRTIEIPRVRLIVAIFSGACVFAFIGAVVVAIYLLFFRS